MDKLKKSFISEAQSLLDGLETSIIYFDNEAFSLDLVNHIFRVIHTLKGSGGMFGFEHVLSYTHDMETLFNHLREGKLTANKVIIGFALQSVDHLRNILQDEFLENEENRRTHQMLRQTLDELLRDIETSQVPDRNTVLQTHTEEENQMSTYYIIFYPDEKLFFRGVNILNIFRDLYDLGRYEVVNHSFEDPMNSGGDQGNAWGIYLATSAGTDAIDGVFMFVSDNYKALKIADINLFDKEDFLEKGKITIVKFKSEYHE